MLGLKNGSIAPVANPLNIHVSVDMFFSVERIIASMDKKTRRVLSSTGAYTRTVMKRRMKYSKKVSAPGHYPSARKANSLLRDKILFGYDLASKELVVGPTLLNGSDHEVAAAGFTVPQFINVGGVVLRRKIWDAKKKQIRRIRSSQPAVAWTYRPRPFVSLTLPVAVEQLEKNMAKFELK